MTVTTINLSDGQLRELRALGVENVSELMRGLVQQYIRRLRSGKADYLKKKERATQALEDARSNWFHVCLQDARERGDQKAIKYFERLVSE